MAPSPPEPVRSPQCVRLLRKSFGRTWVCGPSGLFPFAAGMGWNTSTRPTRLMNTRGGLAASITPIAELFDSNNPLPQCAPKLFGHIRIGHTHACVHLHRVEAEVEQDRSRSASRIASASGPSSVSTLRRCMAQASCGRHSATRWFQLSLVVLSEAKKRSPSTNRIRIAPRSVAAEKTAPVVSRSTGSSGSRMNSAMAPKVPRLQLVAGSAKWAPRTVLMFTL